MFPRLFGTLLPVALVAACDLADPARPDHMPIGERSVAVPQGFQAVALPLADLSRGRAEAVNIHGDAVGWVRGDGPWRAAMWTGGALVLLDGLSEAGNSRATDLNDAGVVVGWAEDAQGRQRAVRWIDGIPEDLGTLGGEEAAALGINRSGQIVGVSETEGELQAFVWDEGTFTALPPGPAAAFAYAEDINDHGVVVGWSGGGGVVTQDATVWIDGVPARLPPLAYETAAWAINQRGEIVGGSNPDYQFDGRGVRWVDGAVEDLPTPPDVEGSSASDINDRGQIVGFAGGAAVWTARGFRRVDEGYGWGINDRGDVVGERALVPVLWRRRGQDLVRIRPPRGPSATPLPTGSAPVALRSPTSLCRESGIVTPGVRALCGR
ncbi:MAG TPA: hypothetical protein VK858_10685 [Longimicrobiales bacterium]|nr:hypothetical protein [Longimicrobiales bacterium]